MTSPDTVPGYVALPRLTDGEHVHYSMLSPSGSILHVKIPLSSGNPDHPTGHMVIGTELNEPDFNRFLDNINTIAAGHMPGQTGSLEYSFEERMESRVVRGTAFEGEVELPVAITQLNRRPETLTAMSIKLGDICFWHTYHQYSHWAGFSSPIGERYVPDAFSMLANIALHETPEQAALLGPYVMDVARAQHASELFERGEGNV